MRSTRDANVAIASRVANNGGAFSHTVRASRAPARNICHALIAKERFLTRWSFQNSQKLFINHLHTFLSQTFSKFTFNVNEGFGKSSIESIYARQLIIQSLPMSFKRLETRLPHRLINNTLVQC